MKLRHPYTFILTAIVVITLFEELFLRKYLYHQHIDIIADCLPNFLSAPLFIFGFFVIKGVRTPQDKIKTITAVVIGLVAYEIAQIWMPGRVFDIKDIIATIAAGILAYIISRFIK